MENWNWRYYYFQKRFLFLWRNVRLYNWTGEIEYKTREYESKDTAYEVLEGRKNARTNKVIETFNI